MNDVAEPVPAELDEMGPVDYLVLEYAGGQPTGESLSLLLGLVDRGIVRVLDLLFFFRRPDGSVVRVTPDDGSPLAVFSGAASGMLGPDDLREVGGLLTPGRSGVLLVYENLWAAPLARALRRAGGSLAAGGRIPIQALLAVLDAAEVGDVPDPQPTGRA